MSEIIQIGAILLGGGAFGGIIVAFIGKKKTDAEAKNTNIKSILEIDQRMHDRLVRLEERVAKLETENAELRESNAQFKYENERLKFEVDKLEKMVDGKEEKKNP